MAGEQPVTSPGSGPLTLSQLEHSGPLRRKGALEPLQALNPTRERRTKKKKVKNREKSSALTDPQESEELQLGDTSLDILRAQLDPMYPPHSIDKQEEPPAGRTEDPLLSSSVEPQSSAEALPIRKRKKKRKKENLTDPVPPNVSQSKEDEPHARNDLFPEISTDKGRLEGPPDPSDQGQTSVHTRHVLDTALHACDPDPPSSQRVEMGRPDPPSSQRVEMGRPDPPSSQRVEMGRPDPPSSQRVEMGRPDPPSSQRIEMGRPDPPSSQRIEMGRPDPPSSQRIEMGRPDPPSSQRIEMGRPDHPSSQRVEMGRPDPPSSQRVVGLVSNQRTQNVRGLVIEPEDIVEENNQTAASTATAVFISKGSELTEQQLNQAPSIVYVEREDGKGFRAEKQVDVAASQSPPTDGELGGRSAVTFSLSSSATAARSTHQALQQVAVFLCGLLAGFALLDVAVSYVLTLQVLGQAGLLQYYSLLCLPVLAVYVCIYPLVAVSIIDRIDPSNWSKECLKLYCNSLQYILLFVCLVLMMVSLIATFSVAFIYERMSLFPSQPDLWSGIVVNGTGAAAELVTHRLANGATYVYTGQSDTLVSGWLAVSTIRAVCSVLMWLLLVWQQSLDRLGGYLVEREKEGQEDVE